MLSPAPSIDVQALMRGLVHELRNPLAAILTASSLLKGGVGGSQSVDDETAMLLEVVEKESRRMNRILTEFSSFVKPPVAHPEPFDVARTLRELVRGLQSEGTLQNIEVRDDLPAQLPVMADPVLSYQAFHHLLSNAAEAMEGSGVLHLHSGGDEQTAAIFLDDSGTGISEDALQRVFQPFFSTKGSSTGLGLSIANGLLRASGGEVSIHNRASEDSNGSGARVRVHLPRPLKYEIQS